MARENASAAAMSKRSQKSSRATSNATPSALHADWQQFRREADVLPNLKWLPSTSPNPGADHQPFWNTILPIDHPFWAQHRPGDRWNCKCDLTAARRGHEQGRKRTTARQTRHLPLQSWTAAKNIPRLQPLYHFTVPELRSRQG